MIDSGLLREKVSRYRRECLINGEKPTQKDLAIILGVSCRTVFNVVHGSFNGFLYTDNPAATRCIDNNDFEMVRRLFDNG